MKTKQCFILIGVTSFFLIYTYLSKINRKKSNGSIINIDKLPSFSNYDVLFEKPAGLRKPAKLSRPCRMETCFDFSRCTTDPKIYVYPTDGLVSASYRKVLSAVRQSRYATQDPKEACWFLPAVDTLDADPLSPEHVPDVGSRLSQLPYWNNGRNHIIFNLYAGTWPDYAEDALGFNSGEAILARASASETIFRHGFDVSLPLFHKEHPEHGGMPPASTSNPFPAVRKHLLAFKGKRYVHGIGSETRNSLWHLHDSDKMILVTTCKHGKSWKDMRDERCDEDNIEYDKYDYEQLLSNSTFCLVARGRRLGSYRFLEALAAGCIPVLLSNSWRLPFDERIDWSRAVIWADERLLLQVPELVRSVSHERILALRQQTQFLWDQYFSSIEKIVSTTIEILLERVSNHRSSVTRDALVWNSAPGALSTGSGFADSRALLPLSARSPSFPDPPLPPKAVQTTKPVEGFTALLYTKTTSLTLHRLLNNLAKSKFCHKVVILWDSERSAPSLKTLSRATGDYRDPLLVTVVDVATQYPGKGEMSRWLALWAVPTSAVFSLDGDTQLIAEEMDFAFTVWQQFTDRIVCYSVRNHFWDEAKSAWAYSSRRGASYSLCFGAGGLVSHVGWLWQAARLSVALPVAPRCWDLLLATLTARASRLPPIKLAHRPIDLRTPHSYRSPWTDPENFLQRQSCLNTYATTFGYMPLMRSGLRLDPILFKDQVSNLRKKYRKMELITR